MQDCTIFMAFAPYCIRINDGCFRNTHFSEKRNIMKCNASLFSPKIFWFYSLLFTVQYLFYSKPVDDITFGVFKSQRRTEANMQEYGNSSTFTSFWKKMLLLEIMQQFKL